VAIASLGHLRRRGSFPDLSQRTFAHIRFEAVDERHAVQVGTPTMAGDIIASPRAHPDLPGLACQVALSLDRAT
jgi:hypothetical protein